MPPSLTPHVHPLPVQGGESVFIAAVRRGLADVVRLLVDKGIVADVNAPDNVLSPCISPTVFLCIHACVCA